MRDFDLDLGKDLVVKYVEVSLSNKLNYTTVYNVQNTRLNMRCGYNTRTKSRWIVITDSVGDILLSQTFLRHKKRCELNFNANLNNLNYYLTLKLKDNTRELPKDYDYINWADDFDLYFVGYSFDLEERLKDNRTILYVGN